MKFGACLPSFAWEGLTYQQARVIKEFAQRAEVLGFDSLWVAEHPITAPGLYGVSWLSPLTVLAYAASCTEKIKLGTSIIILPLRNPVMLAKEIVTLVYLSGGRFTLGIGPGWYDKEFEVCGMRLRERGWRTDEGLEIIKKLLTERNVSYEGRYYRFQGVTIEPLPPKLPPIWVAGGSKAPDPLSPDKPFIAASVLKRIAGADGWIARAAGNQQMVKDDWQKIKEYLCSVGRDPASLTFAHINFVHLVDTPDHDEALRRQRPLFERVMGTHRPFEHLQQGYFMGTTAEIGERIEDLRRAGLEYLILHPLTDDAGQLDRWASEILPRFSEQSPSGGT